MIGQNLSNINETCYSVQVAKICNLNKALIENGWTTVEMELGRLLQHVWSPGKKKEILPLKKVENSTLEHCEYGLGKCHAAWFLQNSDGWKGKKNTCNNTGDQYILMQKVQYRRSMCFNASSIYAIRMATLELLMVPMISGVCMSNNGDAWIACH